MPTPAHLDTKLEIEFNNRDEALSFLQDLRTQFMNSGQNGYICLVGSDTMWRLANEFADSAAANDPVKFVCPAQDELFRPLTDSDFIAEAHLYNQGLAEEYEAFHEEINRHEDLNGLEAEQARDDAVALILKLMEEGKISKKEYEFRHDDSRSDLLNRVHKISYDLRFIERATRKYGIGDPGLGTQLLTLRVSGDDHDNGLEQFAAPFNPTRTR